MNPKIPKVHEGIDRDDPLGRIADETDDDYAIFMAWVMLHPDIRKVPAFAADEIKKTKGLQCTDRIVAALAVAHRWIARLETWEAVTWEQKVASMGRVLEETAVEVFGLRLDSLRAARKIVAFYAENPSKAPLGDALRAMESAHEQLGAMVAEGKPFPTAGTPADAAESRDLVSKMDQLLHAMKTEDAGAVLESVAEVLAAGPDPGDTEAIEP